MVVAKPSPGPYYATESIWLESPGYHLAGGQRYAPIWSADHTCIALVLNDEGDDEGEANLTLFAAAPELLAFLRSAIAELNAHDSPDGEHEAVILTGDEANAARALFKRLTGR